MTGDLNVHSGRDIRLGIEVDDKGAHTVREGSRSETKGHRGFAYSSLEGADAKYVHK